MDGGQTFSAQRLLGAVLGDGIAEHYTKIWTVSYMAGMCCYRSFYGHSTTNSEICA